MSTRAKSGLRIATISLPIVNGLWSCPHRGPDWSKARVFRSFSSAPFKQTLNYSFPKGPVWCFFVKDFKKILMYVHAFFLHSTGI